jgi:hypothetical protein
MTTWAPACCARRSQNDPLGHDEAPLGHQLGVRPDPSLLHAARRIQMHMMDWNGHTTGSLDAFDAISEA